MRHIALVVTLLLLIPSFSIAVSTAAPISGNFELSQFTLQTFNRNMNVTAFVTPDNSVEQLYHFLDSAQQSIYIEIYQFNSPAILEKIIEIHDNNPSLDIKLMLSEHVVSLSGYNVYTAWNLTQLGIPVRWTSDIFTFSHQKFIIIDNKTTIVQSGNWAKASYPMDDWQSGSSSPDFTQKNWEGNREFQIALTDTEVTGYYRSVFDHDWDIGTDYNEGVDGTGDPLEWGTISYTYYPRVFSEAATFSGSMNVTPVFSPDTSLEAILWCINSAQATLDIEIPYINNNSLAVRDVIDAIVAAKQRGVSVRIISNEGDGDNDEISQYLADLNIPLAWMDTRFFALLHNKAIIVDGRMVLICSINWSGESITENREAGVVIEHEGVGAYYQSVFNYDWGLADCDAFGEVNIGWLPNIPDSTSSINVTTYAHMLFSDVTQVILGVKINNGAWTNYTVTSNVYKSSEHELENYYYLIGAQADGTNITVQSFVEASSVWYKSIEFVIPVRDSLGSTTSIPTTPTTPTTTATDPLAQFLAEFGIWLAIAGIGIVCGGGSAVAYKKGMIPGASKKTTRKSSKKKKK